MISWTPTRIPTFVVVGVLVTIVAIAAMRAARQDSSSLVSKLKNPQCQSGSLLCCKHIASGQDELKVVTGLLKLLNSTVELDGSAHVGTQCKLMASHDRCVGKTICCDTIHQDGQIVTGCQEPVENVD
ncbi:unnamed protein product [Cyclocybe aegerita]|uniref:Hydrophobin n=1 Tax=Cyclocybe aegerita TaxID=1973307 RepID=A0A8S0WCY5_CYCAE|nr:unnamed protein product [Cyclocybe aegerita]